MRLRDERGQVVPLLALVSVVLVIGALGVAKVAGAAAERARVRNAADAAALAGAAEGRDAAGRLASDNGAEVERYVEVGGEVEVTVRVGDTRATARARRDGP